MGSNSNDVFREFFGGSGGSTTPAYVRGGNSSRNPGDSFPRCLFGGSSSGDGGPFDGCSVVGMKPQAVESKLACSLEELYKGSTKQMKISRTVSDQYGKVKSIEEMLNIEIKAGWKKGTKITFAEKGNQEPGYPPADLIFVVDEKPHAVFKRDGNDLSVVQKISVFEALTGKTLNLTTLDGRNLNILVTDIVKPGHEMVISSEGMPISREPGKKGNLKIKFDVRFPSHLTEQQKAYLKRVPGGTAPN